MAASDEIGQQERESGQAEPIATQEYGALATTAMSAASIATHRPVSVGERSISALRPPPG